jgi:uncharacterized protein
MALKIAISGSSGLVGSALVAQLRQLDAHLLLLRRPNGKANGSDLPGRSSAIEEVPWNPSEGVTNLSQLEGVDAVFHLAGRSIGSQRWTQNEKRRLIESRVAATKRLTEQLCQLTNKPKCFIGASAVGIYGNSGDQWVAESSPRSHDFLGDLAYDWEQASEPLLEHGVRVMKARFGVVLGKGGGALAKMLPIFRFGLGGILGSGKQYWSWIGLDDCCRALVHLMNQTQCNGAFNIVSPNPVTNRQFTKALGAVVHRPTILPAPAFALRLAMGEMADALLLTSCRASSQKLEQSGFHFRDSALKDCLAKICS